MERNAVSLLRGSFISFVDYCTSSSAAPLLIWATASFSAFNIDHSLIDTSHVALIVLLLTDDAEEEEEEVDNSAHYWSSTDQRGGRNWGVCAFWAKRTDG